MAEVLVVGAGPVGLVLALELARYGVQVRLIDKRTQREHTSRAVAVWSRTMELLDRSGVTANLLAVGNKVAVANIHAAGRQVGRIDFSDVESPYPFALMIPQYETEQVLIEQLRNFDVHTELGVELLSFKEEAEYLQLRLRRPDGTEQTDQVQWLVACDGAHSTVRHQLGTTFAGDSIPLDWTQGDFRLSGPSLSQTELSTYWHESGIVVMFPMGADRYRVILSLGAATDAAPGLLTVEAFQQLINERALGDIHIEETIWMSAFRINERQVPSYRFGRVLLAGDAAHVHSPAGGQGMNTGMQDAINLAWKLALVCRAPAPSPILLDSYDLERRPVGAQVIKSSGRMTKFGTVQEPTLQHIRNFVAHILLGMKPVQRTLTQMMAEVSVGYPGSPINGHSERGHRASGTRVLPVAGQTAYGSGCRPEFALHANDPQVFRGLGAYAQLLEPTARPALDTNRVTLVRPDGYVAIETSVSEVAAIERYLCWFDNLSAAGKEIASH